jgi:hypothetical protein
LKDDGVNISDWLTALCLFTGHAAKQLPGIDLFALAQYLVNQLRAGEGLDLLLLKELVSVMTVCHRLYFHVAFPTVICTSREGFKLP